MRRAGSPLRFRLAVPAALALLVSACAGLLGPWGTAPNGLSHPDDRLRRDLAAHRFDSARVRVGVEGRAAPDDELLRLLYQGIVAHYAGDYAESNQALDRAVRLAEDRYTKSVSRGALSLISSDRVLAYTPDRAERLLIHYYGALNYLRLGDLEEAAVEARRLSSLLERYEGDGWVCGGGDLCRVLRYVAGAVFEAAGEENDAAVAYRHAGPLVERFAFAPDTALADASGTTPADSMAEVVVLLEQGFVAHRAEEAVMVLIHPDEVRAINAGDADARAAVASLVAARVLEEHFGASAVHDSPRHPLPRREAEECDEDDEEPPADSTADRDDCESSTPYLLRIAWPVYRDDYDARLARIVVRSEQRRIPVPVSAHVSRAVVEEFEDERLEILARTIARAATKFAVTRKVEKELGKEEEALGTLLGLLTNVGGMLLERADTRSWHLLPDAIGVVRLRLPPGRHDLAVEVPSGKGGPARTLELGTVTLRRGELTFVSGRVWR